MNYNKLTQPERREVRLQYIGQQGGMCHHCNSTLSEVAPKRIKDTKVNAGLFPKGFFDHPVHLHHNHDTGMTIGAVHSYCNAVLWQHHGE